MYAVLAWSEEADPRKVLEILTVVNIRLHRSSLEPEVPADEPLPRVRCGPGGTFGLIAKRCKANRERPACRVQAGWCTYLPARTLKQSIAKARDADSVGRCRY